MFYNILFSRDNKVAGFMTDMDEIPVSYVTENEAYDAKKGHIAETYIGTIEIQH